MPNRNPLITVQTPYGRSDALTGQIIPEVDPLRQEPVAAAPVTVTDPLVDAAPAPVETEPGTISRSALIERAKAAGMDDMNRFQRKEWLDNLATELASNAPEATTPEAMNRALRREFKGQNWEIYDGGSPLTAIGQTIRNLPATAAGGLAQVADFVTGTSALADSALSNVVGDEAAETISATPYLREAAKLLRSGQEWLQSDTMKDTRDEVARLTAEERYGDLFSFLTTSAPGIAFSAGTVAESLVPFTMLNRVRQAIGLGSGALGVGATAGALGTGTTAANLSEDGVLSGEEALGSALVGGSTGLLTGGAARLAPTPEALIARLMSDAPAAARTTPQGMVSYLTNTLRGAGVEGLSEGAQEAAQALVETGFDVNGEWSADRVDAAAIRGGAVTGTAIGLVGGTASGVADTYTSNRQAEQAAAVDSLTQTQQDFLDASQELQAAAEEADPLIDRGDPTDPTAEVADADTSQSPAGVVFQIPQNANDVMSTPLAREHYEALVDDINTAGNDVVRSEVGRQRITAALDEIRNEMAGATTSVRSQLEADAQVFAQLLATENVRLRRQAAMEAEAEAQSAARQTEQDELSRIVDAQVRRNQARGAPTSGEQTSLVDDPAGIVDPLATPEGREAAALQWARERGIDPAQVVTDPADLDALLNRAPDSQMDIFSQPSREVGPADPLTGELIRNAPDTTARPGLDVDPLSAEYVRQAGDLPAPRQIPESRTLPGDGQVPIRQDTRGRARLQSGDPITERVTQDVMTSHPGYARNGTMPLRMGQSGVVYDHVVDYVASAPDNMPPRSLFNDEAWLGRTGKSRARFARNIYDAEMTLGGGRSARAELINHLSDIMAAGQRPDGSPRSPGSIAARDAQRAADILEALRLAEEIHPVDEVDSVDYEGNLSLPAGKLPAGNDATLQHHREFGEFLERGDIAGALRWARDNLKGTTNKLVGPLATMAGDPSVTLRVRLESRPGVIRGRSVEAWYDPITATVHITRRSAGTPYYTLHETAHALTENAIQNPDTLSEPRAAALQTLRDIYEDARDNELVPEYARGSLSEFVAEAWSNPDVQARMTYTPEVEGVSRLHNAFRAFTNAIRRVLGLASGQQTALESVAVASYALTSRAQKQSQRAQGGNVPYTVAHMYRRDPDTGKKVIVATVVPDAAGRVTMNFLDGSAPRSFPDLAAANLAAAEYGARITELVKAPQNTDATRSVFDPDALTPLAKAVRRTVDETLGRFSPEAAITVSDKLTDAMRQIKTRQVNRMAILQELQRLTGVPVFDRFIMRQSEQRARTTRDVGDIATMTRLTGEALAGIGSSANRFGDYLYALHAVERNKQRGKGGRDVTAFSYTQGGQRFTGDGTAARTEQLVNQFMRGLSPRERDAFPQLEKQWRAIMDEMLDAEYELGLYDRDTYLKLGGRTETGERIGSAYEHYVPLLNESQSGRAIPGTGVVGRDTTAANPYESLYRNITQRSNRLAHLGTRKDLLRLLQQHPMPELATVDSVRVTYDEDGNPQVVSDNSALRNNSIYVPDNGGWKRVLVKPNTGQGRAILEAFNKNPYDEDVGRLMGSAAAVTRTMAAMNTTYNPAFALKSLVWDATTTLFNFQGAFDRDLSVFEAYRLSLQSFTNGLDALARNGLGVARGARSTVDPILTLFNQLGGGVNVGGMADGQAMAASLRKYAAMNASEWKANPMLATRSLASRGGQTLGEVLHSGSQALRYGAFKAYLQHKAGRTFGANDIDALARWTTTPEGREALRRAVVGSKELSGNFELRGSSRMMSTWFAFWNSAMQGTRLFASMASTAQGLTGMLGLGILGMVAAMQAVDDPEDEDVDGGSRYARSMSRRTSLLLDPDSGAQVPVAYELRLPFMLGQSFALVSAGKITPTQAFTDVVSAAKDMFLPLSAPGTTDTEFNLAYSVSPTAVQTLLYPMLLGKDPFGVDIDPTYLTGPDGTRIENPARAEQVTNKTAAWATELAQTTYRLTDGTIDISPARLSQTADNLLGGAGRFVSQSLTLPNPDLGFGDSALTQQLTREFRHRANPRAISQEYEAKMQDYQAKLRISLGGAGDDMLQSTPQLDKAREISTTVNKRVRALKTNGMTLGQIYSMQNAARADGDEDGMVRADNLLREYYAQRDIIVAWGTTQLNALQEQYDD